MIPNPRQFDRLSSALRTTGKIEDPSGALRSAWTRTRIVSNLVESAHPLNLADANRTGGNAITLAFNDSTLLPLLLGDRDTNLGVIERELNVHLSFSGNLLTITGTRTATVVAHDLFHSLWVILEDRRTISSEDFNAEVNKAKRGLTPDPPSEMSLGPGPVFEPTDSGFEIKQRPVPEDERTDSVQRSLYARLQQRVHDLGPSIIFIHNEHKALAEEFENYHTFLSSELASLDVASLWSIGAALSEHVRALDTASNVMTPALEPSIRAAFIALLRDHAAFVEGFSIGRDLRERVIRVQQASKNPTDLREQSQAILRPMSNTPSLLAKKAKYLVDALVKALAGAGAVAFDLLASSSEIARNSLIAFARVLHPILLTFETANIAMMMAGQEHPEALQAAIFFLRDNASTVAAFAAADPQISAWLVWLVERLHDFKID